MRRLPIFVVASSKFFVLLGPSYATRCWCMLELFVFIVLRRCGLFSNEHLIIEPLQSDGGMHLDELASAFDLHKTKCYCDVCTRAAARPLASRATRLPRPAVDRALLRRVCSPRVLEPSRGQVDRQTIFGIVENKLLAHSLLHSLGVPAF